MRDLAAVAEGGADLVLELPTGRTSWPSSPRASTAARARRARELVMDTRRRLEVNVSEALALEAFVFRIEYLLSR